MSRGLPGWTVGQTELSRKWESSGCPGDSLVGLWDRQDYPGSGSPRDVLGTPWLDCEADRTVGQLQGEGVLGDSLAELNGKHYGHT